MPTLIENSYHAAVNLTNTQLFPKLEARNKLGFDWLLASLWAYKPKNSAHHTLFALKFLHSSRSCDGLSESPISFLRQKLRVEAIETSSRRTRYKVPPFDFLNVSRAKKAFTIQGNQAEMTALLNDLLNHYDNEALRTHFFNYNNASRRTKVKSPSPVGVVDYPPHINKHSLPRLDLNKPNDSRLTQARLRQHKVDLWRVEEAKTRREGDGLDERPARNNTPLAIKAFLAS